MVQCLSAACGTFALRKCERVSRRFEQIRILQAKSVGDRQVGYHHSQSEVQSYPITRLSFKQMGPLDATPFLRRALAKAPVALLATHLLTPNRTPSKMASRP